MTNYWQRPPETLTDAEREIENRFLTRKLRCARNRTCSAFILQEKGYAFESKNDAAHLIVRHNSLTVDFWPGTGKYIPRTPKAKHGRGVFNLIKLLEAHDESSKG